METPDACNGRFVYIYKTLGRVGYQFFVGLFVGLVLEEKKSDLNVVNQILT